MIVNQTKNSREMFDIYPITDLFLTTTNSVVKVETRELVMGSGHALQFVQTFDPTGEKQLKARLGVAIAKRTQEYHEAGHYGDLKPTDKPYVYNKSKTHRGYHAYGLIVSEKWPNSKIGIFQTKFDWAKPSSIDLIKYSFNQLKAFMERGKQTLGRPVRVDMPFPGIGKGGLNRDDVLEIASKFGDNLHLWEMI